MEHEEIVQPTPEIPDKKISKEKEREEQEKMLELEKLILNNTDNKYDTILLARKVKPGLASYNLDSLAFHFKVRFKERHRSIGDCEVTAAIFWQCVETLRPRTIDDLLKKGMIKS